MLTFLSTTNKLNNAEWPQIDLLYFLPEWQTMKAQGQASK
jgi:hypothetical protein